LLFVDLVNGQMVVVEEGKKERKKELVAPTPYIV